MKYSWQVVAVLILLSGCGGEAPPEEKRQENILKKEVGTLQDARKAKALNDTALREREKAAEALVR